MWDETGERLMVDLLGNVLRGVAGRGNVTHASQESMWRVLVARVSASWGWAAYFESQRLQLMFPPLPLSSTTAEALWSGLVLHYAFVAFQEIMNAVLARAIFGIEVHTSDDASSNEWFHAHFLNTLEDVSDRTKSLSHQTDL